VSARYGEVTIMIESMAPFPCTTMPLQTDADWTLERSKSQRECLLLPGFKVSYISTRATLIYVELAGLQVDTE
jgi:hypothetical protein